MLDTRGFVAETNATHVFIVRNSINRAQAAILRPVAWWPARRELPGRQ